jgi:hypothetical protein
MKIESDIHQCEIYDIVNGNSADSLCNQITAII